MTPLERKVEFRTQAARDGLTLHGAAYKACGVTWFHLSQGIQGDRSLSDEVKEKFSAYIGRSVKRVFGEASTVDAATRSATANSQKCTARSL